MIVGIDPSLTRTGIAVIDGDHISVRGIPTTPAPGLDGTRQRIRYIVGTALRGIDRVDLTVIEKPVIARASGSTLERAWLFGMLVDQFATRGPVVEVHQATRAKYASGRGNARKAEVIASMRARFPDLRIRNDDEADALALACAGARHLGAPVDGALEPAQLQALTAVHWPTPKGTDT